MAQRVGYFDNDVTYTEGPFVIVPANGWRIEVDHGGRCPVLPHTSIYRRLRRNGMDFGKTSEDVQASVCDWLNELVRQGKLVKTDHGWISPDDMQGLEALAYAAL